MMNPSNPAYNIDWVYSNNSNVHVTNKRGWFKTFHHFGSYINPTTAVDDANKVDTEGIGDVELAVKTHPTRNGRIAQGILLLRDVLYAPAVLCNILGCPILQDCTLTLGSQEPNRLRDRHTGVTVALLDSPSLWRLRLRGQSPTQTSLDPGGAYVIGAIWPISQRILWHIFKLGNMPSSAPRPEAMSKPEQATTSNKDLVVKAKPEAGANKDRTVFAMAATKPVLPPLTPEEKAWLKTNFRSEYHFLLMYHLSIYKDEDRAEGRSILKALMAKDEPESDSDDGRPAISKDDDDDGVDEEDENSSSSSTNSFLHGFKDSSTSHLADRYFNEKELKWIEIFYWHSGNFMLSCGLKPWCDQDCKIAQSMVRRMMENS